MAANIGVDRSIPIIPKKYPKTSATIKQIRTRSGDDIKASKSRPIFSNKVI